MGCVIAITKARLLAIQVQAKVCDVVRFSFLVSSLTAKAAPCTRSDSQTVQKLPEEKKPVDGWMPKSSLGGLSSPEEEQ